MMHPLFAEWYRKASIAPEGEQLVLRWKAVAAFAGKIDAAKSVELVRCFLRLPWKDEAVKNEFAAAFQATDPAFPMRENGVELQVLAGATLVALQEQSSRNSDTACAILDAAAAPGLRRAPVVPEILEINERYIFKRSTAVRAPSTRNKVVGAKYEEEIEAVRATCATNQAVQVAQPLVDILSALNETINKVAQTAEAALTALQRTETVQAEESNIIWWVFGETSRDLRERFSKMPNGLAAVLAGKELADLTHIIPGPLAARAYLDKILGQSASKKVTLADVAKQVPQEWAAEFKFDEAILDLCPVLNTLHEAAQQRELKAQDARKQLAPLDMALQTYRECVAVKILRKK